MGSNRSDLNRNELSLRDCWISLLLLLLLPSPSVVLRPRNIVLKKLVLVELTMVSVDAARRRIILSPP